MNFKRIFNNSAWMAISRVAMAGVKFVTVPLLLHHYGKENFGLIALAVSLNAYLQILSMGLPSGIVRFVAVKLGQPDQDELGKLCGSGFSLYLLIGFLNALILGGLSFGVNSFFNITPDQAETLKFLIIISAISSFLFWIGSYLEQLLRAAEEIAWLSKLQMVQVVLEFVIVWTVTHSSLSIDIPTYFLLYLVCLHVLTPLKIWRWRKYIPVSKSLLPRWDWKVFKPVFSYSIWMFLFSFLVASAHQLRPLLLGARAVDGAGSVAEYRILQGISAFVLMAYGWIATPLLPAVSKAYGTGGPKVVSDMILKLTKPTWAVLGIMLFGFLSCSKPLLILYVGEEYSYLSRPLDIWLIVLSVNLFLGPSGVGVMATGQVRPLALMTFISCFFSLCVMWFYSPALGLGAAVYAIVTYNVLQLILYMVVLLPRLIEGSVLMFFIKSYFPTLATGLGAAFFARWVTLWSGLEESVTILIVSGAVFLISYLLVTALFVIPISEMKKIRKIIYRSEA